MKLEFESNAVSPPFAGNQLPTELEGQHGSPEAMQLLKDGIKAAQSGDRAEARNLLLRVTETDSENENAWLWLASISEYPEELLVFLNNVLEINPENERALEWAKATKSLIAKTFVQRGIDAAKSEQKTSAKQCFLQAIVHDSDSELAWLWLASVTDSAEEKVSHLQKVLNINPENGNAQSSLRNAKQQIAKSKLPKANDAAISGDHETAHVILNDIISDAPDFEDAWMLRAHISESFDAKIAAFERVLEINPENPVARANIDSLKMFSGNVSDDKEVPKPMEAFDAGMDSRSNPVMETETYSVDEFIAEEADDEYSMVEQEPEAVSEQPVEFEAVEEQLEDDSEEVVEFEAVEEAVEEDVSSFTEEDAEEVVFESSESAEVIDHDYEAEAVDVVENSSDESGYQFSEVDNSEDVEEVEMEAAEEVVSAEFDAQESTDQEFSAEDDLDVADLLEMEAAVPEFDAAEEFAVEEVEESAELEASEEVEAKDEESAEFEEVELDSANPDEDNIHESNPPMPSFEASGDSEPEFPTENTSKSECPYCFESNDVQAFACHGCKAIFTISDIDMILSHSKVDKAKIEKALKRMESDKSLRGVDVNELKHLGIGYINLKDFRKGFDYLQEASKKDPNDVVLISQIDALAVRLSEIEDHARGQENKSVGCKILVVDDSPTVRKLISGKLEKCGHEAICAVDGMDALAKINEVIPDLILLDITMPRMDGYQVCKLIRSNDATKDVPVVMISGKDGFFDKVRGRMAGTSNYITKPFGPETLMKAVNEYIN